MQESSNTYIMEHPDEAKRLDVKTDPEAVKEQAHICGMYPGATVMDVGCGSGKVASILSEVVGSNGAVLGVDFSADRIAYARENFAHDTLSFHVANFTQPMDDVGEYDFIWMRFVLEYFSKEAGDIVANLIRHLKPEGRICLLDLDHNSLNHYPMSAEMERVLHAAMRHAATHFNFDPYAGRKLYAHLYDLGFRDIRMHLTAHHLLYGSNVRPNDVFNWQMKVQALIGFAPEVFATYPGGSEGFMDDFVTLSKDPRRFTYTPLVICTGSKPRAL